MSTLAALRPRIAARHLMWLPAAALVSAGMLAAFGVPLTPTTFGASATGTTTVNATVLPEIHIIAVGAGSCNTLTLSGASMASGPSATSLGQCLFTFGTNNGSSGATLRIRSQRPVGQPAFCRSVAVTAVCASGSFTDQTTAGNTTLTDGAFGARVRLAQTCTTAGWTFASNNYYGIPDGTVAGSLVCTQNAGSDASFPLEFWADPTVAQGSGSYSAAIDMIADAA